MTVVITGLVFGFEWGGLRILLNRHVAQSVDTSPRSLRAARAHIPQIPLKRNQPVNDELFVWLK
jgi:hypothetical protein